MRKAFAYRVSATVSQPELYELLVPGFFNAVRDKKATPTPVPGHLADDVIKSKQATELGYIRLQLPQRLVQRINSGESSAAESQRFVCPLIIEYRGDNRKFPLFVFAIGLCDPKKTAAGHRAFAFLREMLATHCDDGVRNHMVE